jgi:hypothetical protein
MSSKDLYQVWTVCNGLPSKLRKESADGSPLLLTEQEAQLFRQALPAHLTECMLLSQEKVLLFLTSEWV